jgi:predicted esterase
MDYAANWDCTTCVEKLSAKVDHNRMPHIMIIHGHHDKQCPLSNVVEFKSRLITLDDWITGDHTLATLTLLKAQQRR